VSTGQTRSRLRAYKKEITEKGFIPCAVCDLPITKSGEYNGHHLGKVSVDHIIPIALGGNSRRENLQPTHSWCNTKKGDKPNFKLPEAKVYSLAKNRYAYNKRKAEKLKAKQEAT
jgi:5-methylcytosine-specific restriction endonuclease McrA